MGESFKLTEPDRRLVGALQLNGRTSWTGIARALGAPQLRCARRGRARWARTATARIADLAGVPR